MQNLKSLLNPKSIAVIGASRNKLKLGRIILDNILEGGFTGKVYPVNPKVAKTGKLKCYSSVKDIAKKIDVAVIAIPAKFVYEAVRSCCDIKVGNIIVLSAGFSEIGQDGLELEYKIAKLAEKHNISLLGPNCLGIISQKVKLNATFAKSEIQPGNIAFLSQSGALGTAALDWAQENGLKFSHFISIGNKSGLSENDFLEYFAQDKSVKAIALYLEDFSDGRRFMKIASKVKKPIVVLKPGKSKSAQAALGSHTGSLAQDDLIVSSSLKQSGVLRVESLKELFVVMKFFSEDTEICGNRVAIVTNAGGPGVITTDAVELAGLDLAEISSKSQKCLALELPAAASLKNPVDVLGDALADRYKAALDIVAADAGVDSIIVILTPQVMTEIEKTASLVADLWHRSGKIILPVFIGGKEVSKGIKIFKKQGIFSFGCPIDAVRVLAYLAEYHASRSSSSSKSKQSFKCDKVKVQRILDKQSGVVDLQAAEKVLKAYKVPLLTSFFPQDIAAGRRFARKLSYPIVMKLIHPELLHKTDIEAVRLNISSDKEMECAFNELMRLSKKLKLEGAKIQMQHFLKGALELIIGVKHDSDQFVEIGKERVLRRKGFGHTILFGMGGIYTEVYKDVALKVVPLSLQDAEDLMAETKVSEILQGARGQKYNIEKIRDIFLKLSQLVSDFPQIAELDMNPVFAKGSKVIVVDVKMILGKKE